MLIIQVAMFIAARPYPTQYPLSQEHSHAQLIESVILLLKVQILYFSEDIRDMYIHHVCPALHQHEVLYNKSAFTHNLYFSGCTSVCVCACVRVCV